MAAHTDPFTNRVSQDVLELQQAIVSINNTNGLPSSFLPTALHEYTHQRCFAMPVGIALAAVRGRIDREMAKIDNPEEDPRLDEVINDLNRYTLAWNLLNPIVEGLACFAEYESLPGPSPSISPLYDNLVPMFRLLKASRGPHSATVGHSADALVAQAMVAWREELGTMRRNENGMRNKQNLCYQPLRNDTAGAYLLGNVMLKALRRRAIGRTTMFADTEFFLGFAMHAFFSDFGLASVLLEHGPDVDFRSWWAAVRDRTLERARAFDGDDLAERAAAYEQALLSGHPENQWLDVIAATLGMPEWVSQVEDRLSREYQVPPKAGPTNDEPDQIDKAAAARLLVRGLIRVSSGHFPARPTQDGFEINLGDLTVSASAPQFLTGERLGGGVLPVRVTLTFDPGHQVDRGRKREPAWLLSVSTLAGRLVGQHVTGLAPRTEAVDRALSQLREFQMQSLALLDAADESSPVSWRRFMDEFEGYAAADLRDAYGALAAQALGLDVATAEPHLEAMNQVGLVGLVDGDAHFAGELVALSAGCGSGLRGGDLAAWLHNRNVSLGDLLARARRWQTDHGVALVHTLPTGEVDCTF